MRNTSGRQKAKQTRSVAKVTSKAAPTPAMNKLRALSARELAEETAAESDSFEALAYQAAHQATLTRTRYQLLEARAVRLGRQGGVSWDVLGGWLTVPGETLRRRYS